MGWLNPFDGRAQRPIPTEAAKWLREIPSEFSDDGCTNSPDSVFGFKFRWACRIHNWRYCSRCHPPGTMHYESKLKADAELARYIGSSLPFRWRWVRRIYLRGVHVGGGFDAWNSCGPEDGDTCRHGIAMPDWMHSGNLASPISRNDNT